MKRIVLDCSAVRGGGGLQLATGFVASCLSRLIGYKFVILAPRGSPLKEAATRSGFSCIEISANPLLRFIQERKAILRLKGAGYTHIFTFFGCGLGSTWGLKSVVNCAYPIICYPESRFWKNISSVARFYQRLKNYLRVRRLRMADVVACETPVMAQRLGEYAGIERSRIKVVPPAPSSNLKVAASQGDISSRRPRFVYVTGLGVHKNAWRLPEIIESLEAMDSHAEWEIAITCSEQEFSRHLAEVGRHASISDRLVFLGTKPPQRIHEAYLGASYALQLSDLESVSNNFLEAAHFGLPMVCSDRDFARYVVAGGAAFCEPGDPGSVAKTMLGLLNAQSGSLVLNPVFRSDYDQIDWWRNMEKLMFAEHDES